MSGGGDLVPLAPTPETIDALAKEAPEQKKRAQQEHVSRLIRIALKGMDLSALTADQRGTLRDLVENGATAKDLKNYVLTLTDQNKTYAAAAGQPLGNALASTDTVSKAVQVLIQNGADAQSVRSFFFPGGANSIPTSREIATAELINVNPGIVPFFVRRFPSQGVSDYFSTEMTFGFTQQLASRRSSQGTITDIIPGGRQATTPTAAGPMVAEAQGQEATRYDNGIMVIRNLSDPTQEIQVLYPTDPKGRVAGSTRWLDKRADAWDQETVNHWRKRLVGLGYGIPDKGPFDSDFRKALALAYKSFWQNGKKWPTEQSAQVGSLKQAFDPALARTYVRSFFESAIGDDPTDQELKQGEAWLKDFTRNQLHQGISPSDAFNRAEAHYSDKLYTDPQVSMLMNQQKENTTLRDSLIQAAQASSQIAGGS